MSRSKTLITGATALGLVLGWWVDPQASLPLGAAAGLVAWLVTLTGRPTAVGLGEPVDRAASRAARDGPARSMEWPGPPPSLRAEPGELEHLEYARGLLATALLQGLIDPATADRLNGLIEDRRRRAFATMLAPTPPAPTIPPPNEPSQWDSSLIVGGRPSKAPPAADRSLRVEERVRAIKDLIASDVAVHGLAYLGVVLLFAGAFGFTLFSFNTIRVGLRPLAELSMPAMLLGSAWFLRRKGAPVVAAGLGLIGGLLLPVMLFASFVDGVAFPPELQGVPLAGAMTAVSLVLAMGYAAYSARHRDASLRHLVAPMLWGACWAAGLLLARDGVGRIDLRNWSAGQLALVSVGVAATAVFPRLRPGARLAAPVRTSAAPGIAIVYALTLALAASEAWSPVPVVVAGLAALVTIELLAPRRPSVAVVLLQPAILAITASALMAGLGVASGGAVASFAFLALLEWQQLRRPGVVGRAVAGAGVAAGLGLSLAAPWASVASFGVVAMWAHGRRAIGFAPTSGRVAVAEETAIMDAVAAVLPLGAAWGLMRALPDGAALVALAVVPLVVAVFVRLAGWEDRYYSWWVPCAAAAVIAGTAVVSATQRDGSLAAASAMATLAIAVSPRWPAARVWAAAAGAVWTASLAFRAADLAFGYRSLAMSLAGLIVILVSSVRRAKPVAGHVAAVGALLAMAGLSSAPTERFRFVALATWCAVWLVMTVDQQRGGAPLVAMALRAVPPSVDAGRMVAAIPALVLVSSLPFLAAAGAHQVGLIAEHRSWSGVVLSGLAIGYAGAGRSMLARRTLAAVLAGGAFAVAAVGIAVAAPAPWPSIEAVASLVVVVSVLGGGLRRPVMTWTAWAASGVLALQVAERAGVPVRNLPWVLLGWGAVLLLGGLALDDARSGRRTPGEGLRRAWLAPPVALGALAVPIGLAFVLTGSPWEVGWWSLAGAGLYLLVAVELRAGSVSAASYALMVVAASELTPWSVLDRPWTGAIWAAVLVGASALTSRTGPSKDPWMRWDLAPLAVAHAVAAVALARSFDVGAIPATWIGVGSVSTIVAALRRRPAWAVAGAAIVLVGAQAAGPGWLALALGGYSVASAVVASGSRGPVRWAAQLTSMAFAAGAWSQLVVWAGWPADRTAVLTASAAAGIAVAAGLSARWARMPADWVASLGGLCAAGALAVAALAVGPSSGIDPHTGADLLAMVSASMAVGVGMAARPTGVPAMRDGCAILVLAAGALLGYGRRLDPPPLTWAWSTGAIVSTVAVLGVWRARPTAPWIRPLALVAATAGAASLAAAGSGLPRKDLLEVALLVAGIQTAGAGIVLRRPEPLYASPLLFCAAWLLFASEALTGEMQWFTVPIGIALLLVVGVERAARRGRSASTTSAELLVLEYLGMAFVVGDGLVESIATSPTRGLFALGFGVGLAAWGALTRVRRRVFFGAGAALVAVTMMVGGPIARLVPEVSGPALWIALAVSGAVLIALATGLERSRATAAAAIGRLRMVMEGWE